MACFALCLLLGAVVSAVRPGSHRSFRTRRIPAVSSLASYSFVQFQRDFGLGYAPGSAEYQRRAAIFQASLVELRAKNARLVAERRTWTVGVNRWMDWTSAEKRSLHGYKPDRKRHGRVPALAALQTGSHPKGSPALNTSKAKSFDNDIRPGIRNQGDCGSCWAISAVEAIEAQLLMQGGDANIQLSAQALIDCVPNPQHCGGKGGCDGATGELAYAFIRDYGIPLESDLEYEAVTGACPVGLDGPWPAKSRVRLSGWSQLPSNRAAPLEQALVTQGPAVVAVDANNWLDYNNGIFDDCEKDAILGHAVLLMGYGEEKGIKYWHIQNSWGEDWGENGNVRIIKHDDESSWCGTDNKPQEGLACDGGPPTITVCGTCGILYDPTIPQGVRLEGHVSPTATRPKEETSDSTPSPSVSVPTVPKALIVAPPEESTMAKLLADEDVSLPSSSTSSATGSSSAPTESSTDDIAISNAPATPSAKLSTLSTNVDVDEERMKLLLEQK